MNMDILEMKHTCWRCLHSEIVEDENGKPVMICGIGREPKEDWNEQTDCGKWTWNSTTRRYIEGKWKDAIHNTLTEIYRERMRKGTF